MRLRRLEIERFRGIQSLDWRKIGPTAALVGPGDSGKSTIVTTAYVLWSILGRQARRHVLIAGQTQRQGRPQPAPAPGPLPSCRRRAT